MGQRLKQARTSKGLTQEEVGRRLGVTRSVIARYESGLNDPSSDNLAEMARLYSVTTDWLLGRTEVSEPLLVREREAAYNLPPYVDELSPELQAFLRKEAAAGWPHIKLLYDANLAGLTAREIEQVLSVLVDVKKREEQAKE